MLLISPAKVIAACSGLAGFSIAILAGLAVNNPTDVILLRAVAALFICYVAGGIIGALMDRAVTDAVTDYKTERPLPSETQPTAKEAEPPVETRPAA